MYLLIAITTGSFRALQPCMISYGGLDTKGGSFYWEIRENACRLSGILFSKFETDIEEAIHPFRFAELLGLIRRFRLELVEFMGMKP